MPRTKVLTPEKLATLTLRGLWYGLIPLLLVGVTLRYLSPARDTGDPLVDAFAGALEAHRLAVALALFVGYSLLVRYWSAALPGARFFAHHDGKWTWRSLRLTLLASLLAAVTAWLVRATVVEPFVVTGVSMLPALEPGDYLLANKLAYRGAAQSPRRGDVVVLDRKSERDAPQDLVKRVIGLPGDHVAIGDGVTINGWRVPSCDAGRYFRAAGGRLVDGRVTVEFLDGSAYLVLIHTGDRFPVPVERTVEAGEVFVLGDDRDLSADSRTWGESHAPARLSNLVGRVERVLWREAGGTRSPLERLLRRVDLGVAVEGIDMRDVESGISACLSARPRATTPPPAPKTSLAPGAQAKR